ncbi:B12-binding domain-containing radical SAM protein [bacterium]|nr:B12-binding domain-containing radical SAM protein [bacterium]
MSPDLVGFSTTTSSFLDAVEMAGKLKGHDPTLITVCGGVHVSALGANLLAEFSSFDYLCPGEGEETLSELVSGHDPSAVKGLIWRSGNEIVTNPPRPLIKDIDTLPFPAYEKLRGFPKGYNLPLFSYVQTPGATMITSSGCPYQCSYCDRSVFKKGYRYNSSAYVYEHMSYLQKHFGIKHINIYDDLFTANRKRITELCELLQAKPLGIQFNCAVRMEGTDDDLLRMLKASGCLMVSLGIESADEAMLERHKSGVNLEAVKETVRRIQAAGLRAKGLFMMGLPGETLDSIKKTSDFIISLGLDDQNMTKFTPFPGAPLWSIIEKEGSFENNWRLMNCLNFVFVPKGIESKEKLDQYYNQHVKRFYNDTEWRRKFKSRIWQHRRSLWHILKNLPAMISAKRAFEPLSPGAKSPRKG